SAWTWAIAGSAWRSPTRPPPSPPACPRWAGSDRARMCAPWPISFAGTRSRRSWWGCRGVWTAASVLRPRRSWLSWRTCGRRAGEYALEGEISLDQIVDKMVRGDVVHHMVTFPEGTDVDEMSRIVGGQGIAPAAFLEAARDVSLVKDLDPEARDLEGYLFPD